MCLSEDALWAHIATISLDKITVPLTLSLIHCDYAMIHVIDAPASLGEGGYVAPATIRVCRTVAVAGVIGGHALGGNLAGINVLRDGGRRPFIQSPSGDAVSKWANPAVGSSRVDAIASGRVLRHVASQSSHDVRLSGRCRDHDGSGRRTGRQRQREFVKKNRFVFFCFDGRAKTCLIYRPAALISGINRS